MLKLKEKIIVQQKKTSKKEIDPRLVEVYKSNWIGKHRGHRYRYWSPKEDDKQPWLEIDLGEEKTFNNTSFREKESRIRDFELQYLEDEKWVTYYKGGILDVFMLNHEPITTKKVRLVIKETVVGPPRILTFDLFNEETTKKDIK